MLCSRCFGDGQLLVEESLILCFRIVFSVDFALFCSPMVASQVYNSKLAQSHTWGRWFSAGSVGKMPENTKSMGL